jgi:hypothetical protein
VDRGSVVSIATRYGLDGLGIQSRCWSRFSAPVQTGRGAHLASYIMGTGGKSVAVTTHLHLAPMLQEEWSYTSTTTFSCRDLF